MANKKFLILGSTNAISLKDIFVYLKDRRFWLGCSSFNDGMYFVVPDDYKYNDSYKHRDKSESDKKMLRVSGICWYTNMNNEKRDTPLSLTKRYIPENYPKYVDCDAVEVSKVSDIPMDYTGVMGVPITFLDKWCPDQFEIVGLTTATLLEKSPIDCEWSELLCDVRKGYKRILIKRR